jgi:hypothetical protein
MTFQELVEMRSFANVFTERLRTDPDIDHGSRVQLDAALEILREFSRARMEMQTKPRPKV